MQIISDFNQPLTDPVAVALGNFDGVHLGHQLLIKRTLERAQELAVTPAVCTFTPHPEKFYKIPVPLITTDQQKFNLLEKYGIKVCYLATFDDTFAATEPENFIKDYLVKRLKAKAIIVGDDFCFGKHRRGTPELLQEFCHKNGLLCDVVPRLEQDGRPISSTAIRALLLSGQVEKLPQYLGQYISYTGQVRHGEKIGITLGYPTANLHLDNELPPAEGIYAGYITLENKPKPAMIYVGRRPTFTDCGDKRFEVNIINYTPKELLYGKTLEVFVAKRLRDDMKFDSLEKLSKRIGLDQKETMDWFRTEIINKPTPEN